MKRRARTKKSRLELDYDKFFHTQTRFATTDETSLEQPSPLRIVPSVGTSGAYEEPIELDNRIVKHAQLG